MVPVALLRPTRKRVDQAQAKSGCLLGLIQKPLKNPAMLQAGSEAWLTG